jgi:hypothetical protein
VGISDRTLLEVSREYLHGIERAGIERRHLVDLDSGEVFREERARGAAGASVGPCPRVVQVGLGEMEPGASPRRLRLLQYAVANEIKTEHWTRLLDVAQRSFGSLAREYRSALSSYPGLAEPFAVLAPKSLRREDLALLDAEGLPLPLVRSAEGFTEALLRFVGDDEPDWVAGRLIDAAGTLLLVPTGVGVDRGVQSEVLRIA